MNSLCRYITWCVNNEQKNTKVLSVCLQIQFHLSIFTPWAFDQNCLKKPHSSKRTDYLGTLYWAHHKKYTISATSPWKLELIKKQKRSIHYECLGACSRESDLIQQGLLTLHNCQPWQSCTTLHCASMQNDTGPVHASTQWSSDSKQRFHSGDRAQLGMDQSFSCWHLVCRLPNTTKVCKEGKKAASVSSLSPMKH